MLSIAGGILIAVAVLVFLPLIARVAAWLAIAVAAALAVAAVAAWPSLLWWVVGAIAAVAAFKGLERVSDRIAERNMRRR